MGLISLRLSPRALLASVVLLISASAVSAQAASIIAKPTGTAPSYYVLRKAKQHCRAHYTKTKVTVRVRHGKHVVKRSQVRCVAQRHSSSSTSTSSPTIFPPDLPTVTVTVTVIPSAANHTYATQAGVPLSVGAPGVLQGATGTGLSAVLVSGPAHGSLTLHHDGGFSYTPAAGASGVEQFVYRVSSSDGESSTTATVTLKVTPVAAGGVYNVAADGTLQIPSATLLASDVGTGLSAELVSSTIDGSLSLAASGSATYTPNTGFSGADSFTYDVVDASGLRSNTATVTINVGAQPPSVVDQTFNGAIGNTAFQVEGVEGSGPEVYVTATNALAGDSDPNAGGSVSTVPDPSIPTAQGGTVDMGSEGNFTYYPPAGFRGLSDTFQYTVTESEGLTATATATIDFTGFTVWYVNDANTGTALGTSTEPYRSVAQITQAQAGDTIFLFAGDSDYTGGIALPDGVSLVGAGASLYIDGDTLLAQSGPSPTVTNSGGAGITVGEGDSIAGLAVADTSGDGIAASGIDGFTVASSVSVSGAGGDGLDVNGGGGTIDVGASISEGSGSGHSVAITNRESGSAVTLTGQITDDGGGILLDDNAGSTVFSGAITASTGTRAAFVATNAGAIAATAGANSLATTTAQALTISDDTTIDSAQGSANLDFESISADGADYGVEVSGTGASQGKLIIDGGDIQNATTEGVSISGLPTVNVSGMTIASCAAGMLLDDVQFPTVTYDDLTANGGDGIQITNDGSTPAQLTVEHDVLEDQGATAVSVDLADGGNGLIEDNAIGTVGTAASGSLSGDGVDVTESGGTLTLGVEDNTVAGIKAGSALNAQQQDGGDLELTLTGETLVPQTLDIDPTSTANAVEVDSASSAGILCLAATDNTIADPHSGTYAISVDQEQVGSTFDIQDYPGSGTTVATYLGTSNTFSTLGATALAQSAGSGFGGGACTPPQTING